MPNRYYQYNPLQQEDYAFKLPTDILGKTLMNLQDQSDKNYAELSALPGMIHTQANPGHDTTARNKIEQGYRDQIDKMVAGANGDYSRVNKDVIGLKAKLQKDITMGDLSAIGGNYKVLSDFSKEALSQKDLPRSYADAAIAKTLKEYNDKGGYGGIDPVTGNYRQIDPIRGQGYDIQGKLAKIGEFKPMSQEEEKRFKEGDWYRNRTISNESVTLDRVQESMLGELTNDPMFKEHAAYRQRIGQPMSMNEIRGIIDAEAKRRAYSKNKDTSEWQFDPRISIESANERARLGRAQTQKLHDQKMEAEFGVYDGRQAILGAETTGNFSGELNFSGGVYDKTTGQSTSAVLNQGNLGYMGYSNKVSDNPNAITLTGKEPINFDHPLIKSNPIAQKALTATYMKLTKDRSLLAKSIDEQNKILSNWSSNPDNQASIQAAVKEETKKMATVYNNKSVTGFRIAGKQAEAEGTDMLAASRSIKLRDLNTGQDYGTLSDYLKSQDIDERNVSTTVNDSKENTGAKLHVTSIKNGYRTIEIKTKNGTRSMVVEGFDRDRENSGNDINFMTKRNDNTAFYAPIQTKTGYENMTRIDNNSGYKTFTSQTILNIGDVTADGITIKDIVRFPDGSKGIEVIYPNGTADKMPFDTENDASRRFHQKDKARLFKTKSSLRTSDVEYTNTGD